MNARRNALKDRPLLIAYFPLGDPATPLDALDVYAQSGVDYVELGWPARDPYLDGSDVRASMARASQGAALADLAQAKRTLRGMAPRSLLMTYAEADHPALENDEMFNGLDSLLLVAPPHDPHRRAMETRARRAGTTICVFLPLPLSANDIASARQADGYVMLQAAPGVTGLRPSLDPSNRERIALLRREGVSAPLVLGFGVSQAEHARAAVEFGADGIVVGSAALRAGREGREALGVLLRALRSGLDG